MAALTRCQTGTSSATQPLIMTFSLLLLLLSLAPVASAEGTDAVARLACLARTSQSIFDIVKQFAATSGAETSEAETQDSIRSLLIQFGESCLGVAVEAKTVNIMVPHFPGWSSLAHWTKLATKFEQDAGVKVNLSPVQPSLVNQEMVFGVINTPGQYDGWIFLPEATGAVVALGGLTDLTPFIRDDTNLRFSEYNRFYREVSAAYGKQIVGLPMDGDLMLMYYRSDLFTRYNLTVPETWDDLLDTVIKMNGTDTDGDGKPDLVGFCVDVPGCKANHMLHAVAGSHIQYLGTTQGYFFDPDIVPQLKPLNNNPGMRAALKFWHDIKPYSNAWAPPCSGYNADFHAGSCLMSIDLGDAFAATLRRNASKLGVVGVAPLPGCTHVLDRATNTMVPCDAKLCPFGHAYTNPRTGQKGWVNNAPFAAFGGWTGGVSNFTSRERQRNTFAFLAYVNSPNNSWEAVLDPDSTIQPFRDEHLNDVERWVQAGYQRTTLVQYLNAIKESLANPNVILDTRLAYDGSAQGYYLPPTIAIANATQRSATNETITSLMQYMEASYYASAASAVNKLFGNNSVVLAQQYWRLIGRSGSVQDLINSRIPPEAVAASSTAASASGLSGSSLAAAIAVPIAVLTAVLAIGAFLYVRHARAQQHLGLFGKVLAPGVGPNTTLVIIDMQDSTTLFEVLPAACMDEVMQLFCSISRATLTQHKGYESTTEGDSFIIAFHTARDAVMFCMDLQVALLSAPWPSEVLEAEGVSSAHPYWVSPTRQAHACAQMLRGATVPSSRIPTTVRWNESFVEKEQPSWYRKWLGRSTRQAHPVPHPSSPDVHDFNAMESAYSGDLIPSAEDDPSTSLHLTPRPTRQPVLGARRTASGLPLRSSLQGPASTSGSMTDLHSSGVVPQPVATLYQQLVQAWQPARGLQEMAAGQDLGRQLVWAGPRVRCGVASGLFNPQDALNIKNVGRTQFSGDFLAAAKLMEACAHGGQILLSQSTFDLLNRAQLPADVVLLHMGKHLLTESSAVNVPAGVVTVSSDVRLSLPGADDRSVHRGYDGVADFSVNPMGPEFHDLYTIMHGQQMPRLAALAPPKVTRTIVRGALDAPVGVVTIAFLNLVGMPTLKAWDAQETAGALVTFASTAKQQLLQARGYLVDHVDGSLLAAFTCPKAALDWALALQHDMLHAPWSPALLKQALAEELIMAHVNTQGNSCNKVLMRGPRIKVGLAIGSAKSEVCAGTGRINYRGKALNRAARIVSTAATGQVLCCGETWAAALTAAGQPAGALNAAGLKCLRLGETQLKGIKRKIEICQVHRD